LNVTTYHFDRQNTAYAQLRVHRQAKQPTEQIVAKERTFGDNKDELEPQPERATSHATLHHRVETAESMPAQRIAERSMVEERQALMSAWHNDKV
jgi:hypothetical protein